MERRMSRELATLQRRVGGWRSQGGGRGSRIPEELWNEAARVASEAGLWATARALRFNYEGLKKRVAQTSTATETGSEGTRFVTLEMPQAFGGAKTVVELAGQDGERMRFEVAGAVDLLGLMAMFWRRRS
jgi:hypothetical protein